MAENQEPPGARSKAACCDEPGELVPLAGRAKPLSASPSSAEFEPLLGAGGLFSDSGKLEVLCELRLHQRFLLIESELLVQAALAHLADAPRPAPDVQEEWVLGRIDRAIDELLVEGEEEGGEGEESYGQAFVESQADENPFLLMMLQFGVEPGRVQQAARRFNGLPESLRRLFFCLVRKGSSMKECEAQGMGTPSTMGDDLRQVFDVLFLTSEAPASGRRKGKKVR